MTPRNPYSTVFQMLQGLWTSHLVSAIAKLGIPDLLRSGPLSAEELSVRTGSDPDSLHRVLRTAAALGIFEEDNGGRFGLNDLSQALRTDAAHGMNAIASFFSDEWHVRSWEKLVDAIRTGRPGTDLAYGMSFFEYLGQNPQPAATFFRGMTDFSSIEGPAVVRAYDFSPFASICDVGGGHGLLLALVLQRNANAAGVLFDQPKIAEEAAAHAALAGVRDRVRFEGGDMFASVPSGMDAYVLKRIVHDWPDSECVKILRNCRNGINPGGKLLIVEQAIVDGDPSLAARLMDLEMMVLLGGRERHESDFRRVLGDSGWRLAQIVPTESPMFVLECEPA